jgi:hypothetical protein
MDEENPLARRHLLIAGTGRAGTSFLVRYLAELGLDTHLGRRGVSPGWDEDANAGLEDAPFLTPDADLPYVIKSPWLYQFIDDLLAEATLVPDAVVIPVRDLVEAATSRCVIEQRAVHQNAPWMSRFDPSWEEWAYVPGGVIYSLNPIDQGRLLAVGFHHLVQRLVAAGVPIIFLAFPKLTEDATYLFEKLRPILPQTVDHRTACSAHRRVADPAKVRVGAEISAGASSHGLYSKKVIGYEPHAEVDVIALRRELARVRTQLAEARSEVSRTNEQILSTRITATDETRHLGRRITILEAALAEATAKTMRAYQDKEEADGIRREETRQHLREIECLTQEISRLHERSAVDSQQRYELETKLSSICASRSWRLTYPYRAVGARLRDAFRKPSQKR